MNMLNAPLQQEQDLEALARSRGFRDAAQMRAWLLRSQEANRRVVGRDEAGTVPPPPQPAPRRERAGGLSGIFDYISRAMGGQ